MALNNQIIDEWLDKEYIEKVLSKKRNDEIKVKSIKLESASSSGENLCGVLTRVHIEYEKSDNNGLSRLIIKSSFGNDSYASEIFREYDIISKEMNIYNDFIPKLNDLLCNINDHSALFPEVIHVDYENQSIILEDLAAKAFVMADRLKGLDLSHIKLALRKLAKMHAASAVLNKRTNGSLEKFDRGMFNSYTETFVQGWKAMLNFCAIMIREFGSPFVEYSEKLKQIVPHLREYGLEVFKCNPNNLNVLVHGDFWTNNVMFKYNEKNEPVDAVLIDFQFSIWGSPAIDLHYFFNNSVDENFTQENQEECVKFYYDELSSTLRKLNFDGYIPSFKEFHSEYLSKEFYALVSTCIFQPIMLNEDTENADISAMTDLDERGLNFKRNLYENPKVKNFIKKRFPLFSSRGLLEIH